MSSIDKAGAFKLGDRTVKRLGYGAMQLAGPGVFGPPKDRAAALSPCCARRSRSGVDHIDTSDFYGPHVTNQIIREALHPYPDDLVIVTKIGARRGADASWLPAFSRRGADRRRCTTTCATSASTCSRSSICAACSAFTGRPKARSRRRSTVLAELQRQGLVRHIGLSNVTPAQIAEGRKICDDRLRAEPLQSSRIGPTTR